MRLRTGVWLAAFLPVLLQAGPGRAMDVGAPLFLSDLSWAARGELHCEKYDRKLKSTRKNSVVDTSEVDSQRLNSFGLRLYVPASETISVNMGAGVSYGQDSNRRGMFVGLGAHFLPFSVGGCQVSSILAVQYTPFLDYSETQPIGGVDFQFRIQEKYLEASAGELLSKKFLIGRDMVAVPFGGLMASVVNGERKSEARLTTDIGVKRYYDLEQDGFIVGVLGAALLVGDQLSLRAEGHFLGDNSLSVAVGYAF